MKPLKKLLSALCVTALLSFSNPIVSSSPAELNEFRESGNNLNQEVKTGLDELISDSEESLRRNISNVEKVFEGLAVEEEIGVGIKIYKNTEKKDYYYFIMASVDTYTDGSPNDRLLFTNDLSFSFDEKEFLSRLEDYHNLSGPAASGRARGTTFVLDDSVKEFYVGVKYVNVVENKEERLVYLVKISPSDSGYAFEGEASKSDYAKNNLKIYKQNTLNSSLNAYSKRRSVIRNNSEKV